MGSHHRFSRLFLTAAALALLSACMPPPAMREAQETTLNPLQACRAQCNRENQICTDQRAARDGGTVFGVGAICQNELQACLSRCGARQ